MNRYAITGIGLVSPVGIGFDEFVKGISATCSPGEGTFRAESTVLSPERVPNPLAAEVWGFDAAKLLGAKGLRNLDRLTRFLLVAAKEALLNAGIKSAEGAHLMAPERIGVCSATAYGSLDVITEMVQVAELEAPHYLNPGQFPNTVINSAAGYVSIWEDLRAPNVTVVDGNCGALDAVLTAETHLHHRRADAFLVGGGEVLSDTLYLAFRKLGLLADEGRKRRLGFSDSDGMYLGEGAAYLCMERLDDARRRGAKVRAELIGYGNAVEPPESEAIIVHASVRAVERAVTMALEDAGLSTQDLDLVCSSLSGIPTFDLAELEALTSLLPDVPLVAPKAWYGESFGAGAAFGMSAGLAYLHGTRPRPLVRGELRSAPKHVLVVAMGYYGNVSAAVMRSPSSS